MMEEKRPGKIRRGFSKVMTFITWLRLVIINLFFLLIIGVLITVLANKPIPSIPEKGALILNIQGSLVDQKSFNDPLSQLMGQNDPEQKEVLVKDVIDAINYAAIDPRITTMVLRLDNLLYGGISKMQEIVVALKAFRETGKKVIAMGDSYTQQQYWLAAHADEVYMNPMGSVLLEGYSAYRNYFKRALDKLKINFHVFRVGSFKSAVEPFTRDSMSAEAREANLTWLSSVWGEYKKGVQQQRKLQSNDIDNYINNIDQLLIDYSGDTALVAVASGLIDGTKTRDQMNQYLIEAVGAVDEEGWYQGVGFERYLWLKRIESPVFSDDSSVGIIVAAGNIVDGDQPPGIIGGDTLAKLVREARRDANVRAVVLRIDSGGGSAFASEIIRRELELLKQTGKPLVVSMGSLAASGGYWISALADEIWATPTTLTGSIGIFGAFPTLENSFDDLGISTDGVGTTDIAGAWRIDRPLSPIIKSAIQSTVEHGYQQFIGLVAEGRDMSKSDVKTVAEGRVWSGIDAQRIGLIDQLGYLDSAVKSAAKLAGLEEYRTQYIEIPLSPQQQLLKELLGQASIYGLLPNSLLVDDNVVTQLHRLIEPFIDSMQFMSTMNDPNNTYLYCSTCIAP